MVRVTHDHNTLDKVVVGLKRVGVPDAIITDAINSMHNEGILFRERAPEGQGEEEVAAPLDIAERVNEIEEESPLVKHARRELGLLNEDSDVIEWYVRTVKAYASFGHSGGSHAETLPVLFALLQFRNIKPLTDDPEEWTQHGPDMFPPDGIWQNDRNPKAFSEDEGKNYYLVDEVEKDKPKVYYNSFPKADL